MTDHAAEMHAAGYWRQFTATMDFLEPGETVVGTIEHLGEVKTRDGWLPRLHIRQDDGVLVYVNCGPKRLIAELIRLQPKVGDRIKIRYLGDEERSAPGMNPVRRFAVAVRPAGAPAEAEG